MISFENSKEFIKQGIDTLTKAVQLTLGPAGRTVAIYQPPLSPKVTKDGVTVAKSIQLGNEFENLGAMLVRDVAIKTCDQVGDGTSTSIILAQAIYELGLQEINQRTNVSQVKKSLDEAVKLAVKYIKQYTQNITDEALKNIAMVSSNYDEELSTLISNIYKQSKRETLISVEDSPTVETYTEQIEGLRLERGYLNNYFITNQKNECILMDSKILVYDNTINSINQLIPILETCIRQNKSILIICKEIDDVPLSGILTNVLQNKLKACVIKMPSFGEGRKHLLKDIISVIGGGVQSKEITYEELGSCDKIIVTREFTTLIGGKSEPSVLLQRINEVKEILNNKELNKYSKEILQKRLSNLSNGVTILKVGANSELELQEKKDRIDDTIKSLASAYEEGVVMSIASLYVHISKLLKADKSIGAKILSEALLRPLQQICTNACEDSHKIIHLLHKDSGSTYDVYNGVKENSNILDSSKSARVILENAASISNLLLTTEASIIVEPDKIY